MLETAPVIGKRSAHSVSRKVPVQAWFASITSG
jgi:hypothetical protein